MAAFSHCYANPVNAAVASVAAATPAPLAHATSKMAEAAAIPAVETAAGVVLTDSLPATAAAIAAAAAIIAAAIIAAVIAAAVAVSTAIPAVETAAGVVQQSLHSCFSFE